MYPIFAEDSILAYLAFCEINRLRATMAKQGFEPLPPRPLWEFVGLQNPEGRLSGRGVPRGLVTPPYLQAAAITSFLLCGFNRPDPCMT
jgi:hypothetical protein